MEPEVADQPRIESERSERMSTLQIYLLGWAFVLGMSLVGIAGAGQSESARLAGIEASFRLVAYRPELFFESVVCLWVGYTLPFAVAGGASWIFGKRRNRAA